MPAEPPKGSLKKVAAVAGMPFEATAAVRATATLPFESRRVGPVFALVAPTTYVMGVSVPGDGIHPQGQHDLVAGGTEVLVLVLFVFLVIAGRVKLIAIRAADGFRIE